MILSALLLLLTIQVVFLNGFNFCALLAACFFFKKNVEDGPVKPMTVIKPIRGLDRDLEENLRELIQADREGSLQILFVMEERNDPAYGPVSRLVQEFPKRNIRLILSGPSGARLGKVHNMIEGLKEARHDVVVFSDADIVTDRDVLIETSRAFADGAEAACALPDGSGMGALTDVLIGLCFNHYFDGVGPLIYRLGVMCPFAGGWMAFRKDLLERLGGLEAFSQCSADDFALGIAAFNSGAKTVLLTRMARIREHGGTVSDLFKHLLKWMKVVRFNVPIGYPMIPFGNAVFVSLSLVAVSLCSHRPALIAVELLILSSVLRIVFGWIQDSSSTASLFPWWAYLSLPAADMIFITAWACAFFSRHLVWRGKTYRLYYGGRAEPVGQ